MTTHRSSPSSSSARLPALRFADELGPEKVLYVWEPGAGLEGVVVVDNTAAGPAVGGIRMSVPDFVANAGGVICASVEYHGGSKAQALATIEERVAENTRQVLERSRSEGVEPRVAAMSLARERLDRAMALRRRY